MGSTIRLRTLGALQLQSPAGAELRSVLSQPRRVALLAYLALATPRGLHRRDKLLALFWPEQDEQHARNALSQAVHFLRRTLGADAILSRGDEELGVNGEIVSCDAIAFEAALDAGKTAEALERYRGALAGAGGARRGGCPPPRRRRGGGPRGGAPRAPAWRAATRRRWRRWRQRGRRRVTLPERSSGCAGSPRKIPSAHA